MISPRWPASVIDRDRLAALERYDILDTAPEVGFDDLVEIARGVCEARKAFVSFVAADRQWFKARIGIEDCSTDLDRSVCVHVTGLPEGEILVIPDCRHDPRTAGNPLVTGDPRMRFYAGVPLRTPDGHVIGSFCVLDDHPRREGLSPVQEQMLRALARQVMVLLELRLNARRLALAETAQAEVRRDLRLSERRHRAIFESAIDYAIVVLDLAGTITNWNEGARRILGWTSEEAQGEHVELFFTPEDRTDRIAAAEMQAALTQGRGTDERWHLRKDGSRFWANGEMMALRDDDNGEVIGFIKMLRDRTEQREAAVRLDEQRRNLQVVLETIPVGILFAEAPSGRIVGGNRRLEDMVGHPLAKSGEVSDRGWTAYHADGRKVRGDEYPVIRIIRENLDYAELECEYERPDGTRFWMQIVGAPMRDPNGTLRGAVVAISDVSARRRADALQSLMNHELSHRLKNLLTIVQAITRQTIRASSDMGELQRTLGDRLMALGSAHDVLLGGPVERAPLAAVIRGGTGVLGELADAQLDLSGPALEVGPAAALPLGLMMHELSTNALKYGALSTPAGRVDVTWGVDADGAVPYLRLLWKESGGPAVVVPSRKGFGSSLITRGVGGLQGGAVTLAYAPEGVECRVEVPLSELARGQDRPDRVDSAPRGSP